MFHHISVGVSDIALAVRFYDEILGALGYGRVMEFLPNAVAYGVDKPSFWIQIPRDRKEPSPGNGGHVAFAAKDRRAVDAFHATALRMGGTDNGSPGGRPNYGPDYYGAFVRDPDGNRLEAVAAPPVKTAGRKAGRAKPSRKAALRKSAATRRKSAGRMPAARGKGALRGRKR